MSLPSSRLLCCINCAMHCLNSKQQPCSIAFYSKLGWYRCAIFTCWLPTQFTTHPHVAPSAVMYIFSPVSCLSLPIDEHNESNLASQHLHSSQTKMTEVVDFSIIDQIFQCFLDVSTASYKQLLLLGRIMQTLRPAFPHWGSAFLIDFLFHQHK